MGGGEGVEVERREIVEGAGDGARVMNGKVSLIVV